jgi:hypothetical protein
VVSGLLAGMIILSGCALPGNPGQDTAVQTATDTGESAVVDYTCYMTGNMEAGSDGI